MDESSEVKPNTHLSRRAFLRAMAVGSAALLVGCDPNTQPRDTSQNSLPATPATTAEVAAAVPPQEFQERDGFTKEMYEYVRAGTYKIEAFAEGASHGSAFLVKHEGNTYYFVTANHVIEKAGKELERVNLWRPDIDIWRPGSTNDKVILTSTDIAVRGFSTLDIVVIRCTAEYVPEQPVVVLPYEDGYPLQKGEKALVVGFPDTARDQANPWDSHPVNDVLTIERSTNIDNTQLRAKGVNKLNEGNSGSPVAVNRKGSPVVVGVFYGMYGDTNQEGQETFAISKLNISPLLIALEGK